MDSDEFTVDTGVRKLTVETDDMACNPLDDEGYQKINQGDLVRAAGEMEDDFFEGRVLSADTVITLRKS